MLQRSGSGDQLVVEDALQGVRIGGESLQQDEAVRQAEDRNARLGICVSHILLKLIEHEARIVRGGVQSVEEEDVQGAVGRQRREVGEGAGGQRGQCRALLDGCERGVLFELKNGLRGLVLGKDEVAGLEAGDEIAILVAHNDVEDNPLRVRM